MNKIFQLTFLITLLLMVCLIAYTQTGTIKGKVRNSDDVLYAATVLLGNKAQLTNNKGEFSFSINPGVYLLTVTHTGYKNINRKVTVEAASVQIVDIILMHDELMGEIVVLGSRSIATRNNLNTAVPIDLISSKKLTQSGQPSLVQMLNFIEPSFNASRQVTNEPITLRGLDPEHTLILLNGARYHNTAWINQGNMRGPLGRGSVGNDLGSIPFSAIEKIEILRDGSSAQYGSDAIAGVIDIRLKESTGKTSVHLHSGQYYKGDGENLVFGINRGVVLPAKNISDGTKKGFLNFSGDFSYQGRTDRGGIYDSTVYYDPPPNASQLVINQFFAQDSLKIVMRGFNRHTPGNGVGIPKLNHYSFLINGGYPVNNHTALFWTASLSDRAVNTIGSYVLPKNSMQINQALYPDGFEPNVIANTLDVSQIAGIKGETKNNWHWDFTSSFGYNSTANSSKNTNNASQSYLGKDAPTSFYAGKLAYSQLTNDINFSKSFSHLPGNMKSFNLGFGTEWRLENYHTFTGDSASWNNYNTMGKTLAAGAQASFGIKPADVVNKNRYVAGTYIDLESQLNDHLFLNLAARYEYYSDYRGNLAGKLAARYKFSDKFSIRGSISNGFRTPSLQQRYYNSTTTTFARIGAATIPAVRGVFPENSPVTKAFDIPSLTAENTINMSGGFAASFLKHFTLTVDAYRIVIRHRIVIGGILTRKDSTINAVLSRYPDLNQIDQVQFFTNAVNTRTQGIDIILFGNWNIHKSSLGFALAANFTISRVFGNVETSDKIPDTSANANSLFPIDERTRLEKGQPGNKVILSMTYKKGKTAFILSNIRFGRTVVATTYANTTPSSPPTIINEFFSPKVITNLSINYSLKTWLTITVGANNIFNVYPDRLQNHADTKNGMLIYSPDVSPFGFNGGYYFMGMTFDF